MARGWSLPKKINFFKCLGSENTCPVQFEILSDKYMHKEG